MNALSMIYAMGPFIQETTPDVPQEVQQLATQLTGQTQYLLNNIAYYGLLIACLTAAISLLFSSLLLVLRYPLVKPAQPEIRLIHSVTTNRQPIRPAQRCVAQANRNELRLASARIRAGQLSN